MPASLLRSVDRTLHSIGDSVRVNPTDKHIMLCDGLDACLSVTFRRSNSSLYRRLCATKSYRQHIMLCESLDASLIRSVDRTLHSIGDCASKSYGQHIILCEGLDACLSVTFRRSNSPLYRRLCE